MSWDINALLEELKHKYTSQSGGEENWKEEKDNVTIQFKKLNEKLSDHYQNVKILARGGTGILLLVEDVELHNRKRVLKFPRPLKDSASEFSSLLNKEIKLLSEIKHRSIVSIHESGELDLEKEIAGIKKIPFYVMDYIEGKESDMFLRSTKITVTEFLRIIEDFIDSIKHLHINEIAHLDIKPSNILIDENRNPVLVDLGTTKKIIQKDDGQTKIGTTWRYACQDLRRYIIKDDNDPDRAEGKIKRSDVKLIWDLETISKTIFEWLECYQTLNRNLNVFQRKYLLLMALRLKQDPYTTSDTKEYGLQKNFLEYLRYHNIHNAFTDIKKITPGHSLANEILEFDDNYHKTIQIATSQSTIFTDRLSRTLDHPVIRRLADISHLGIVKLVYPTATHTRLEHSLGTYQNIVLYIKSLYNDSLNPLFRQLMEPKDIKAALLAALLHDVGQFPLAHDFEDIDIGLFNHSSLVRDIIKGTRDTKLKDSKKMEFPSLDEIFEIWGVTKEDVLNILEAKINSTQFDIKHRILKSLISGPIDADKLDYLLRDSKRLNVTYSNGIDVERLLRCLTIVVKDHVNGVLSFVSVHEKGRVPAEFVTLARYAMFAQVYWHHSVRAVKAMLSRAMNSLIHHLEIKGEKQKFKFEFEKFVLFGIDSDLPINTLQEELFPEETKEKFKVKSDLEYFNQKFSGAVLNSWDIATLKYIRNYMEKNNIVEVELINQIIDRKLYKRLFVFNKDHDAEVWDGFTKHWDELTASQRHDKIISIEKELFKKITEEIDKNKLSESNETIYLSDEYKKRLDIRIQAGLPIILIDIPVNKAGSKLSMEYVLEEDRRSLRKENRICGKSQSDVIWTEYADRLREKAGRIRIYAFSDHADTILAAIDKSWMGQILQDLSSIE